MSAFFAPHHLALKQRATEVSNAPGLGDEEDPRAMVRRLAQAGLLAACVPVAYGGLRQRVELRDLVVVRAALAYNSSLADTLFAMQGLGSYPVTLRGSEAQRQALLPKVVSGEVICAFAITEPEAGSDVSGITTSARRDGSGWVLSGEKCFISNAGIADSYVLFARTSDDRHTGLTAFLVGGQAPGLAVSPIQLIAPHPIGSLHLSSVRVDDSARIGEVGEGFAIAMATLDLFRTSVGAAACGLAARARDEAISRVKRRRQFGKALAEFQATQMAIAEMAVDLQAANLLVRQAAWAIDHGERGTVDAAMAKLYATEAAQRVIDRALQLHGGLGVVLGQVVERLYREVRALRIYEGTSEIQKLVIGRALLKNPRP